MLLSKALRAATIAVGGVFLLSALPAAAAPVLHRVSPIGIEQSKGVDLVATNHKKKKPTKKTAKKKTPVKKHVA